MQVGVHLPQCAFDGQVVDATKLTEFVRTARDLGYRGARRQRPLRVHAAVARRTHTAGCGRQLSGDMDLATTISLPALRGPAPLAAALATLDVLAPGRVIAGIGPGSSRTDYALARVPFEDRWSQFDSRDGRHACAASRPSRARVMVGTVAGRSGAWYRGRHEADPDLDCQLGFGGRYAPGGPARRRLVGIGLSRELRRLHRRTAAPRRRAGQPATTPAPLRGGDDVDVRDRRRPARRPHSRRHTRPSARPRSGAC